MVAQNAGLPPHEPDVVAVAADSDAAQRRQGVGEPNPYVAFAAAFADDSFADEVDAYITAERERQRQEASIRANE